MLSGLLMAACLLLPTVCRTQAPVLQVAAAADLQRAFRELVPRFERETGAKVTLIFGSTGLLARQAEQGAPFDLLFAANEQYITDLEKQGRIAAGTRRLYALGRLVVWTRRGQACPRALADLAQPIYRRIALANPTHAPYGAAAREALQRAGVWPLVRERVVYGENVQQALQYAQTGNAQAGLVALSLALGTDGRSLPVPARLHAPLRQAAGVLARSRNPALARRFLAFVLGPGGQPVMRKYGFVLPPGKP